MIALRKKLSIVLLLLMALWTLMPAAGWGSVCQPPVEYGCQGYSVNCFSPCYCFTYYVIVCNDGFYEYDTSCCEAAD
jgi:hypothetical protein